MKQQLPKYHELKGLSYKRRNALKCLENISCFKDFVLNERSFSKTCFKAEMDQPSDASGVGILLLITPGVPKESRTFQQNMDEKILRKTIGRH